MTKEQLITEKFSIYNSDCMEVLASMPNNCIDFSCYSPPFAGLYNYSSSEHDFSNCATKEEFLQMYEFLVSEMARVTKPGRINAVHCTDVMNSKTESLWDFPHEIIRLHEKYGFEYKNRITIWKEPLGVRQRTMVKSLMHVTMIEDATSCFPAMPDYVLVFRKNGECEVPVKHEGGLSEYFGELPYLPYLVKGDAGTDDFVKLSTTKFQQMQQRYKGFKGDHKENRLSHLIYRRYMSSVWDDIRIDNVLPFVNCKSEDDEKHVHPLQLDVVDRLVVLYTNPGEIRLTPFMGVGTEVYSPVSLGRKGIGIELKDSYYLQAIQNMKNADSRFENTELTLF